jgi:hypothetical protein
VAGRVLAAGGAVAEKEENPGHATQRKDTRHVQRLGAELNQSLQG